MAKTVVVFDNGVVRAEIYLDPPEDKWPVSIVLEDDQVELTYKELADIAKAVAQYLSATEGGGQGS